MQPAKNETPSPKQILTQLSKRFNATDGFVLSVLPGGRLQIAQTLQPQDLIVRRYSSEFFPTDAFAGTVLRESSARWAVADSTWQRFAGFGSGIGVSLMAPVLAGYPGVLLLFRDSGATPFSEAERSALVDATGDNHFKHGLRAIPSADNAVLLFAKSGELVWPHEGFAGLDDRLVENLRTQVKRSFGSAEDGSSGRVGVPDATGEHRPYQFIRFSHHPVVEATQLVAACRIPSFEDWSKVRPSDFEADCELVRLIPAVQYMVDQYMKGPTLEDISASVHLSQFHFHRRFSELVGVTPKHLLFDLQLHLAKTLLSEPARGLADIAKICGFAHQSHFTSRFKQGTGLTPTRWRRLHDVRP